jgi:Fur family transcriptional regulator, ferric uptake regulator
MARKSLVSAALLGLLERPEPHSWTLEGFQAALAERGTTADFSTIYRAAEKLVADGAARKVSLSDGRARYEQVAAHHDHLHCTNCDELIGVPCLVDPSAASAVGSAMGAAIVDHHLVLDGLCPKCISSSR